MSTLRHRSRVALVLACALALAGAVVVRAAEIRVMTSGAFTAAYLELGPRFGATAKAEVVTVTTTMGTGDASIPSRLRRGEAADVVIVNDAALDELIRGGLVVAGSKVPLAQSAIGMAVRAGAPKPDISSVDALRRALLQARSVAYSASVSGDYLANEMFERLGIAEQMKAKSRRIEGERVGAVVARGDAEIGFQQVSELLPIQGIDFVGTLPAEVQRVTVFSAGVATAAANPDAARALIAYLSSPEAASAIRRSGLEPMPVHAR